MPLWAGHGNGEDVAMPDSRTRLGWFLTAHPSEVIEAYAEDGSLHESICEELTRLRADLAAMTSSCDVQQIALEHLREHVRIAAERVVTLTRELQIERDEIRPTAEELTHREVERQLQAKIVTLTQRAEEAEATITCEQQQRLAYSRYISELEARVQTAEQERDELKTDKAFW